MWFEFFIYGLILSGPVWVYQNTQGRGNVLEIPLWMQKPWVSILTAICSLSLIVFIVFGFVVDGFGGLLDTIAMMIGVVVGSAYIPHAIRNILFIFFPFLAFFLFDIIVNGY
tara:strand:+ start:69 stop:404 length:336 start_codon:yes stop_codon:yes gene_type:complete